MNESHDHKIANEKKWSQRAAAYDSKRHDYFRFMQKELIASIEMNSPCVFLDLGCGTGWAVRHVASLLDGNGKFIGIDISRGMIEKSKRKAAGMPDVEFYEASADDLPFCSDYFDTIICSNSFHHYLQPEEALKEVKRVLKPNGKIHILDVTADDLFSRWIDRKVKAREKEHVKFYSTAEYDRMFASAGLTHIRSGRLKILYPLKVHLGQKRN